MSCTLPIQKGVKQPHDCKCHGAVMRAYGSLVEAGRPETVALEAAKLVYGYHHPEDAKSDQALTVERWVNEENLQ
tara:strand:- start:12016 stop:12240 length:225 start_codon:yes stop_codon:yes gene_type:complete